MDKQFDDGIRTVELANGIVMPQIGFGTYKLPVADTQRAVEEALEVGYRLIDNAAAYNNEEGVGAALRATGMSDRVFVTTKLRNADQGYDSALRAFEESRAKLGVDVLDLYLIHWPVPRWDRYLDSWRALVRLHEEGAIRAIGVSNFLPDHIDRIVNETGVVPVVDQIESHPSYSQPGLCAYCAEKGIVVEAFSPLGRGSDMASEPILAAAKAHGVTPAQAVLRWHLQSGRVLIPKSAHIERMRENLDLDGFELSADEMAAIDELDDPANRMSGDPNTFDLPQTPKDMAARGCK